MSIIKIDEQTIYPPIINFLKEIGYQAEGKTIIVNRYPDIIFMMGEIRFIVEIEIDDPKIGLNVIAEAYDYAYRLNTNNIIILLYNPKICTVPLKDPNSVSIIALENEISSLILTDFWVESLKISVHDLFLKLKNKIENRESKFDLNTVINLIKIYIQDLIKIVNTIHDKNLITEVVSKLELFSSIGEIKDKKSAEKQVQNLAAYLLFNQILFYHIYISKTNNSFLPKLGTIEKIADMQKFFSQIIHINYQSIYRVNILAHIPNNVLIIQTLNNLIKSIKLLRAEHISHDLAGRFFHDLIPHEVRKVLAAFYTHPMAAELLTSLTIENWNDSVLDPACGSGTLLVSSYNRKKRLYAKLYGHHNELDIHKIFLEDQISGIDIMPFAAHISAINLTMQNLEHKTKITRIATLDTLKLALEIKKTKNFLLNEIKVFPFSLETKKTLETYLFPEKIQKIRKKGAISPDGIGFEFLLKPVDCIIMNPPFTDRNKMSDEMKDKLKSNQVLGEICGHTINLWGYFLAFADILLKKNGKIGAVIPISFIRGKATSKIREYIIKNYHIQYIVKPLADVAFSEGADFRDILMVVKKKLPEIEDKTTVIFLNKSIKELNDHEIKEISILRSPNIDLRTITYHELSENSNNLMRFLMPKDFDNLLQPILIHRKLKRLSTDFFDIGLGFRPKGVADTVFITNPISKSRIKNASSIIGKWTVDTIEVKLKNFNNVSFILSRKKVGNCIRTITGHTKINVQSNKLDLILKEEHKEYYLFLRKFINHIPDPFPWKKHINYNIMSDECYLVFPRKIRLNSNQTFLISIVTEQNIQGVGPSLYCFKGGVLEDLKIICIFFNSIIAILQILSLKSETLGAKWFELMKSDWSIFKILDISKLSNDEKDQVLILYEKIKEVQFPSLLDQFKQRFWARIEIDKIILQILDISQKEINYLLPKIYDLITTEILK